MNGGFFFLVFLLGIIIVPVGLIFLIAFLASQSRKRKRQKIIDTLPADIDFYAAVRVNSSKKNAAFFKLLAFECSGILYVQKDKAYFRGTEKKFELLEFDLAKVKIFWIGVQAQNGALQWFSIKDDHETYYFNVDTGTTIFKLSKSGDTTQGVYGKLTNAQSIINIGSIGEK